MIPESNFNASTVKSSHARQAWWCSRMEREQAGGLENKLPTLFARRCRLGISNNRQRTTGPTCVPTHLRSKTSLPPRASSQ